VDCIDFCAKNNVVAPRAVSHEIINADRLDEVFKNLASKKDSVKRYVLDCKNSRKKAPVSDGVCC